MKDRAGGFYDLVVLGGGAAGIVATATAAGLGARTLLIERGNRLGGECSWTGCVPSKALIHLAALAHHLRSAGAAEAASDVSRRALRETRATTAKIAADAGTQAMLEGLGAEVAFGEASFIASHEIDLAGQRIRARRVILATGSSPIVPDLAGLSRSRHLTNLDLFELDEPPPRLVIIGAGPIGIEMAQAFARLGSRVTVITDGPRILPRDDVELTGVLTSILAASGIELVFGAKVERVEALNGIRRVHYRIGQETRGGGNPPAAASRDGEELLVAIGRQVNVEGLGLERLGVNVDLRGLRPSPTLEVVPRWLFAAGDVVGHHQFSHVAEHEATRAVRNAFFPFRQRIDYRWMPWCTFTDPELAHLGPTEAELTERGIAYRAYRFEFAREDRARVEQQGQGLVKLLATSTGKLLGAHILGPRAGELMNELVLAVKKGAGLADLAVTVHIYPTLSLGIQRAADYWFAEKARSRWLQRLVRPFTRRC